MYLFIYVSILHLHQFKAYSFFSCFYSLVVYFFWLFWLSVQFIFNLQRVPDLFKFYIVNVLNMKKIY